SVSSKFNGTEKCCFGFGTWYPCSAKMPGKKCSPRAMKESDGPLKARPNFCRKVRSMCSHDQRLMFSSVTLRASNFSRKLQRLYLLLSGILSGSSRVCWGGANGNGEGAVVCAVNKYKTSVTEHVEANTLERISENRRVQVGLLFQSLFSVNPASRASG